MGFIRKCVKERRVLWTYHVNMRMRDRAISRQAILESVRHYELIEAYPDDKYLPSYLVYSRHQNSAVHVLFAADVEGDNVRVITAYYPDSAHWSADLKTRRKS
ncbi:MAG: hypothetical protein A2V83_04690 [Nitrospirae bacterium RBG_16_64_22]|nr:MAG: hypothetical protein A2V83_04690 [Nitrospirae bacterium RBG_16_64_22]